MTFYTGTEDQVDRAIGGYWWPVTPRPNNGISGGGDGVQSTNHISNFTNVLTVR